MSTLSYVHVFPCLLEMCNLHFQSSRLLFLCVSWPITYTWCVYYLAYRYIIPATYVPMYNIYTHTPTYILWVNTSVLHVHSSFIQWWGNLVGTDFYVHWSNVCTTTVHLRSFSKIHIHSMHPQGLSLKVTTLWLIRKNFVLKLYALYL